MHGDSWKVHLHTTFTEDMNILTRGRGERLNGIVGPLVRRVDDMFRDSTYCVHQGVEIDGPTNQKLHELNDMCRLMGYGARYNLHAPLNICAAILSGVMRGPEGRLNGHSKERALAFLRITEEGAE